VRVAQFGCSGDLTQETIPAQCGGELGAEHLDSDLAAVLQILGEINDRHPPRAELALKVVPIAKGRPKPGEYVGQDYTFCEGCLKMGRLAVTG
jgi:hypothetical protein